MKLVVCVVWVSLGLAQPLRANEPFGLRNLDVKPFRSVALWAPPDGTSGKYPTLILLHGNQPDATDPTWMVSLRLCPGFAERILIVPAMPDGGFDFGSPGASRALASLVEHLAAKLPIDRDAIYVVGYSAGASRVLSVALRLPRPRGVIAVAGDVMRPLRDHDLGVAGLRGVPIWLICMTADDGPHTRCALNQANAAELGRRGLGPVALRRLPGNHALDLSSLAPLLDQLVAAKPAPNGK